MGLISLPILNKVNTSNYSNNLWDSNNLYKKYFYLTLFLNKYFNLVFTNYSLNIINNIILRVKLRRGYFVQSYLKKKLFKNFFLGKIWILKYQSWYIIIIKVFSSKLIRKGSKFKLKTQKWKDYYNDISNNINFKKKNFFNYKAKF